LAAILCELVVIAIAVFIGAPIVGGLCCGLTPCEVVTVSIWGVCSHVARRQHRATRQAKVNVIMAIVSAVTTIVFCASCGAK